MAIKYASHNAGGGGAGSFVDPYTAQELLDNLVATDEGRLLNTGVYQPGAKLDIDVADGTYAAPIQVFGRAADDSVYEPVTIDCQDGNYDGIGINQKDYWHLWGLRLINVIRNSAEAGIYIYRSYGSICENIHVDGGDWGIYVDYQGNKLINCYVTDASVAGFWLTHSAGVYGLGLVAYKCAVGFFHMGGWLSKCAALRNAGIGFKLSGITSPTATVMDECGAVLNGDDGIHLIAPVDPVADPWAPMITNNISVQNTGFGLGSNANAHCFAIANLLPSGGADANTGGSIEGNITVLGQTVANMTANEIADFVSLVDGSEDLRLGASSDADNAGWPGSLPGLDNGTANKGFLDIGALQAEAAAAGGADLGAWESGAWR